MNAMVTRSNFLALLASAAFSIGLVQAQPVFELRTYTANEGKLPELIRFFKEASEPAFARHGMKAIGYWVPTDGAEHSNTLIYILEHPSRAEADKNWAAFRTDAEWGAARKTFEANGALTGKIASVYMAPLNIPGAAKPRATSGAFELRTYTAHPGKLDAVIDRFRNGTNGIFNRLNMPAVAYWRPTDGPEHDNTLIYILEHQTKPAGAASWGKFLADPEWVKLRDTSEAAGPIVQKAAGFYMDPTEFSKLK
jgi:hypothetical protein